MLPALHQQRQQQQQRQKKQTQHKHIKSIVFTKTFPSIRIDGISLIISPFHFISFTVQCTNGICTYIVCNRMFFTLHILWCALKSVTDLIVAHGSVEQLTIVYFPWIEGRSESERRTDQTTRWYGQRKEHNFGHSHHHLFYMYESMWYQQREREGETYSSPLIIWTESVA